MLELPVCCGCSAQGMAMRHEQDIAEATYATRSSIEGRIRLGVCLAPCKSRPAMNTTEGSLCGHLTCANCVVDANPPMCKCCAGALGPPLGGAGPLPVGLQVPKQQPASSQRPKTLFKNPPTGPPCKSASGQV